MSNDTLPPLQWPSLPDSAARSTWYRAVIAAYAGLWEGHVTQPKIAPVPEATLAALEARLGYCLPPALRAYHLEFGALSLVERLCSAQDGPTQIQPLLDAYPGIPDMDPSPEELSLALELIVFGDYLGNGNMFCFHRETGAVYYFYHDSPPMLTRFFDEPQAYLDALMILTLAEVYDQAERGEQLLAERFGDEIARKWRH
jgi:hypothetical protein